MTLANIELDVPAVLRMCRAAIPANVRVGVAIEAHKQALRVAREPAITHALRAVILAASPTIADSQQQFDYLASLPASAWEGYGGSEMQEATLRAITRGMRWRQEA